MISKVYIQSANGLPIDDWAFAAYQGFLKKGTRILFFDEVEEVPTDKENMVVGSIEDVVKYLAYLEIPVPKPLNIPKVLYGYTKRIVQVLTLEELFANNTFPIFVKPEDKVKAFLAEVFNSKSQVVENFGNLPLDSLVLTSEVVSLVSEWRGFVVNGNLKALQNYQGDFKRFPDSRLIEQAIADYSDAPSGYSIDFGITADGDTVLIECNDGWSLGSFGCNPTVYTELLVERWKELVMG